MQTIGIVLNVGTEHVEEFENGFREMEAPIWQDLHSRGTLMAARNCSYSRVAPY